MQSLARVSFFTLDYEKKYYNFRDINFKYQHSFCLKINNLKKICYLI